jgi:hypothetical protein
MNELPRIRVWLSVGAGRPECIAFARPTSAEAAHEEIAQLLEEAAAEYRRQAQETKKP